VSVDQTRRVKIGPFVTFSFGSEKGGEGPISGDLQEDRSINPRAGELIATFSIEIDDPKRRDRELYRLAGIEESTYIALNQERIPGTPTEYDERTSPDGKTSSVHWVRFKFIPQQVERFRTASVEAVLGVAHPAYSHMAVIAPDVRAELAKDFG
jgi:Protein of unknown function (DUF3501)